VTHWSSVELRPEAAYTILKIDVHSLVTFESFVIRVEKYAVTHERISR